MLIRCCIDRLSWHLFRGKEFLPGLLAENRDGNGSLPCSRNLISEKVLTRPSTLYGRGRADIHHGPESVTPLKAEYIGADQLPLFIFRLQLCGGPYIPISRFHRPYPACNSVLHGGCGNFQANFQLTSEQILSEDNFRAGGDTSRM